MKKLFFSSIISITIVLLSLSSQAQQTTGAKPIDVKGTVLQTNTENKLQSSPSTTDKDLHQTADNKSSFNGIAPVKSKDDTPQPKAPERQQQLPETNKLVPPNTIKNR